MRSRRLEQALLVDDSGRDVSEPGASSDQNSQPAGTGKTTSARVPPPGSRVSSNRPCTPCSTMRRTSCSPNRAGPSRLLPPSSTRRRRPRACGQLHGERGCAVLEGVGDQLVRDDSKFLGGRSVERNRRRVDDDRHRGALGDAAQECSRVDATCSFGKQPVHARDRADARGRVVERSPIAAVGAAEEEQVGNSLEVVLDPVVRFLRERALEVCACGSSSVSSRLTANRPDEDERHSDRSREQREPHRRRAGRERDERRDDQARPDADGKPEPAAPTHLHDRKRNRKEEEWREARTPQRRGAR